MSLQEEIAEKMAGEFGDGEPNIILATEIVNKVLDAAVDVGTKRIEYIRGNTTEESLIRGIAVDAINHYQEAINKLRGMK